MKFLKKAIKKCIIQKKFIVRDFGIAPILKIVYDNYDDPFSPTFGPLLGIFKSYVGVVFRLLLRNSRWFQ